VGVTYLKKGNFLGNDLFGIFDGHASAAASKYSSEHFPLVFAQKLQNSEPLDGLF
jgi:serine/threonine protein phosphatase PrpC